MDEAAFLRLIRGETRGAIASLARLSLSGVAAVYRVGAWARNEAFDRGWKAIHQAEAPVVSIGNITLGGTGKTPMVEWVARRFREQGVRVAILSRGYGQRGGLNDEGRVLEENLPDVPHLQGADRARLARIAVEELDAQVLVLDDGFQHRRLGRDLDLVMIDALEPDGLGRLFPRGLLREPTGALKRADVVILSRADLIPAEQRARIRREAERRAGPLRWAEASHTPQSLAGAEGAVAPLDRLRGARIAVFCGIGNPRGFRQTLAGLGIEPAGFREFPDHHLYRREDVDDLAGWVRSVGADLALTTQKDLVKLRTPLLGAVPLFALRIGLEVIEGMAVLDEALGQIRPRDSQPRREAGKDSHRDHSR